jgi:hypothetical protein
MRMAASLKFEHFDSLEKAKMSPPSEANSFLFSYFY